MVELYRVFCAHTIIMFKVTFSLEKDPILDFSSGKRLLPSLIIRTLKIEPKFRKAMIAIKTPPMLLSFHLEKRSGSRCYVT